MAGPGSEFFLLPEPGRDLYFFYCQGRGRAGIKKFEMTGAGPGLEKLEIPGSEFFLLPGPARDLFFLLPGPGLGRDLIFFYCRGWDLFIHCRGRAGN